MNAITTVFHALFLQPVLNALIVIYRFLEGIGLPGAFGFSIIALTLLIRLIVWPFMAKQLKAARKMNELRPHLDKLKDKHKDDKQALAAAQMALYKEHGISPAGGCIPTLIQFPVLIALYQSIFALFDPAGGVTYINSLLYLFVSPLSTPPSLDFFGINLAAKPSEFGQYGLWILAVPIFTALFQLLQSKMMMMEPVKQYPSDSPKEKKEKKETEDMTQAMQSQMLYMMPIMIGYFAFQFPIALALYWNTMTLLGAVQQYMISGWGGLTPWLPKSFKR